MFEPDYTIDYCVHELLYAGERENGTYPVLYADFFSKNVLDNEYTRSTIRQFSVRGIYKTTNIIYSRNGLIRSVSVRFRREKKVYTEEYTYSNDNRTITVTYIPNGTKKTFYFNGRMVIDSITSDYRKVTYSYDTLNRLMSIKESILKTGTIENLKIDNDSAGRFFDSRSIPTISLAMRDLSPEALWRGIAPADGKLSRIGASWNSNTLELFKTDSSVFFQCHSITSPSSGRPDIHNIASFYQWNSQGNLVQYAYYHSDDGLKLTFTYGDHYARSAKRLHITHFTPTETEESRHKIKKGKIELLHTTISYHK
jgi:hypothetical protein